MFQGFKTLRALGLVAVIDVVTVRPMCKRRVEIRGKVAN